MVDNLSALIDTVQKNCTIATPPCARHTMCTFLLNAEYYRGNGNPYGARLPRTSWATG